MTVSASGRRPVVVGLHHEVLRSWGGLRRELELPPKVLSLDFHTDTLSAMRRGVPAPAPGAWRDAGKIERAVASLRHDEHFDWAIRAGLVSEVVLLAISPQPEPPPPGIRVFPVPGLAPEDVLNRPEHVRAAVDGLLSDGLFPPEVRAAFGDGTPYILDLDCDFFPTARALEFAPDGFFAELVRHAALVTVAEESDWVRLIRFPGETLTGETAARFLAERISGCRLR